MQPHIRAFVLDKDRKPLMPCHAARARKLLKKGKAAVFRRFPFTIILKERTREASAVQDVLVKIDPGSKSTGIAVVRKDKKDVHHALAFICLNHRGSKIRDALTSRRQLRRGRRSRNLRYRAPRFLNRTKPQGSLAPSLRHRVDTVMSWMNRLTRLVPVTGFVQELVKFDTQLMQNAAISGVEYQQGELAGYELKEYLLEKFDRKCVYCGKSGVVLNVEHIIPKARGGSNRVSNLAIACVQCNQKKVAMPIEDFLKKKPALLAQIRKQLKTTLRDAAAVNATRWSLFRSLQSTGCTVEVGSGAQTKFNRHAFSVPKEHWLDALCTGRIDGVADWEKLRPLQAYCIGRGSHKRTRTDKYGFPLCYFSRRKRPNDFGTGDYVRVKVTRGRNAGIWTGRATLTDGKLSVETKAGRVKATFLNSKCLFKSDGYKYQYL